MTTPKGLSREATAYEWVALGRLKHHPKNPRKGSVEAIRESLRAHGVIRPIVVSRATRHVLAGNHTLKAARAESLDTLPVVWLDGLTPEQEVKILLADNRTSDMGTYDDAVLADLLQGLADAGDLLGTGYDAGALDDLLQSLASPQEPQPQEEPASPPDAKTTEGRDTPYTNKIASPVYEPTGRKPRLSELVDTTKYDQLVAAIDSDPTLDAETRRFLLLAASRHIVFRFANIAEFYCHAPAEVQRHFESSALVIIDYGRAVEEGFVALTEALGALADEEGPT